MKNLLKFLGVVLVAACFLISCKIEKGGTIEVTNGLKIPTYVIIVKGMDYLGAAEDLKNGEGTLIESGAMKAFDKDDDGIYTVVATTSSITPFSKTVTLTLGKTEKVTVK